MFSTLALSRAATTTYIPTREKKVVPLFHCIYEAIRTELLNIFSLNDGSSSGKLPWVALRGSILINVCVHMLHNITNRILSRFARLIQMKSEIYIVVNSHM